MNIITRLILTVSILILTSCWPRGNDDDQSPQNSYEAVILNRAEFEQTTKLLEHRPITNSGKIYVNNNILMVNEVHQGFHIFNNSDPTNPINIAFLQVLGSTDISVKEGVYYVNNATDLIAIKLNYFNETIEITKRVVNAFPQMLSPDGQINFEVDNDQIIVDWLLNTN